MRPKDPRAVLIWSVVLLGRAPAVLPTEAEDRATRSLVVAGDRVVALFESASEISHGGQPRNTYRLLSLDLKTDEIKGQKEFSAQSFPYVFATSDDHVILGHSTLTRLNPDLTESGESFKEAGQGHTRLISPDGSVLAHQTGKETELLSALTLSSTAVHIAGPEATSVSKSAVVSTDARWASQFPREATFITLIDAQLPHLLHHGPCGGRPVFLSDEKILSIGCGKATVIDPSGKLLKELPLGAAQGSFAGVSRNGSRFAIITSDYSVGDPSYQPDELFTIYNSESYEVMATVDPETEQQGHPWSAFSPDGSVFICGGPKKLSLYHIP
jgi:hypothetical protein